MGSGKGTLSTGWLWLSSGRILFELAGVNEEVAREAMRLAAQKLLLRRALLSAWR